MVNRPKRRKDKDNPYSLDFKENSYVVSFKTNKNEYKEVKISEEVFKAFDRFELEDISQLHKVDKHIDMRVIDNTEYMDIILFNNALNDEISIAEQIENKILQEELKKAILELSEVQKRRVIKYYFENKTLQKISEEEGCSITSVKESLDSSINKLRKKLKKFVPLKIVSKVSIW